MNGVINKTTNTFSKGLVMDFSPENTQKEVLTHALNATFLTFNGNETSLQNDMGNARVETAFLPEGYIPVGTCEYGGIIYIVSYNPLEDKSQIGCFPSPERNVSSDELGELKATLTNNKFVENNGKIINTSQYVLLKNDNLNPGDKFIIYSNEDIYQERISDLYINDELLINPLIKINIVSIEDSGKIIYLNNTLRYYQNDCYKYHILGQNKLGEGFEGESIDIDAYRNMLSSGYNVFRSKTSGKLAILAELIMIDSYSVTHEIKPIDDSLEESSEDYEIIIHTEVSPEVKTKVTLSNKPNTRAVTGPPSEDITTVNNNYDEIPKLKYFYLEQSEIKYNNYKYDIDYNFRDIKKSDIFNISNDDSTLNVEFNLPKSNTYHLNMILDETDYDKDIPDNVYSKFEENYYYRVIASQFLINLNYFKDLHVKIYKYDNFLERFKECTDDIINDDSILYFFKFPKTTYIPGNKFVPSKNINWMWNTMNASPYEDLGEKRLYLYKNDGYIINKNSIKYPSVKLGNFKIPQDINSLPFIYNYTLVPCMEYGKLDHLKIKNSIDFSKIKDFNNSNFTTWKYRVDENQLRLTFGSEVYDSFSTKKIKGLFLEFYDHKGFAGSLNISGKQSYSGIFNKIIQLNSLNSLSTIRINPENTSELIEGGCRNYYIYKDVDGKYKLNNNTVIYNSSNKNWYINRTAENNQEPETRGVNQEELYEKVENDLGVLYTNTLYVVKAYFKIENNDVITYVKKKDYVLYTLPIYNEYYYNINDYSILEYPELELMLTYKLTDLSERTSYSKTNQYIDGYKSEDYQNISNYLSGQYDKIDLNSTKYYSNKGITNLFLEIGLKEDYSKVNILSDSYSNDKLNEKFTCKLQLISDNDIENTFDIESSNSELFDKNNSKFGFGLNYNNQHDITSNFNQHNFMFNNNSKSININYEFVLGYNFTISDIRSTEVPSTTICALFHKQTNETYNYSDFSVYKYDYNDSDNYKYYSENFFYNTGNSENGWLGLCKFLDTEENTTSSVKIIIDEQQSNPYNTNYNSFHVSLAKKYFNNLGKLTFCVPHGHIHSKWYGVNLYRCDDSNYPYPLVGRNNNSEKGYFELNGVRDNTYGTVPTLIMYNKALFNLCPITTELLESNSRFISAIQSDYFYDYDAENKQTHKAYIKYYNLSENREESKLVGNDENGTLVEYLVPFTGFTKNEICKFNEAMLNTMKNVYAYNPDYDSMNIKVGDVNLQEHETKFTSNLVCVDSNLNIDNLNGYIYMNGFKYSTYLEELFKYSEIDKDSIKNQITFKPNLKYCGTKDTPYLITKLNYNIPVPKTLIDELSFQGSQIFIKDSEGNNTLFYDIPDKNLLYYYDKNKNNLIQLDISNYTIDENGNLSLTEEYVNSHNNKSNTIIYSNITSDYYIRSWHRYSIIDKYKSACLVGSSITINDLKYNCYSDHRLYLKHSNYFTNDTNMKLYYRETSWNEDGTEHQFPLYDCNKDNLERNYTQLYYGPSYSKKYNIWTN